MTNRALALVDKSALNEASVGIEPQEATAVALYVQSGTGVSAGAVQLEEAPSSSGPWVALGTALTVPAAGAMAVTRPTTLGAFGALRARISTAVVGGTVKAWIVTG